MAAYWSYFGIFMLSLIGLGLFYRNTVKNRMVSFYFLFFAFTTYSLLCNLYFHLPQSGYFITFYIAQSWFVFSYLLKSKKRREPVRKKQRAKIPVSFPQEETKNYAAQ
jgi:hypothetical protein